MVRGSNRYSDGANNPTLYIDTNGTQPDGTGSWDFPARERTPEQNQVLFNIGVGGVAGATALVGGSAWMAWFYRAPYTASLFAVFGIEATMAPPGPSSCVCPSRTTHGPVFDPKRFARIMTALEKQGVQFEVGTPMADATLRRAMAEAGYSVINPGSPGTLFFRSNPTRAQVIQELINLGISRKQKWPDITPDVRLQMELTAHEILIKLGEKKGWTEAEMRQLRLARDLWKSCE